MIVNTLAVMICLTIGFIFILANITIGWIVVYYLNNKMPLYKQNIIVKQVKKDNREVIHNAFLKIIKKNAPMIEEKAKEDIDAMMDGIMLGKYFG